MDGARTSTISSASNKDGIPVGTVQPTLKNVSYKLDGF